MYVYIMYILEGVRTFLLGVTNFVSNLVCPIQGIKLTKGIKKQKNNITSDNGI